MIAFLTFGSFTFTRAAAPAAAGIGAALNTARQVLVHRDTKYLLVELVAGQALDAWLSSNPDPRQDRNWAYTDGPFWTSASYQWRSTHKPGLNDEQWDPIVATINVSQSNQLGAAYGDVEYQGMLGGVKANCWLKTYEIIWTGDGWPTHDGAQWTWAGTDAQPFDANAAIAEVQRVWDDDELALGRLLVDRTETWDVGNYIVVSHYRQSPGDIHTDLKKEGTYNVHITWSKAKVDYSGGYLVPRGRVDNKEKFFELPCNRSASHTLSLLNQGEMLVNGEPIVTGGSDRWVVEIPNQRNCNHTRWWQRHRILPTTTYFTNKGMIVRHSGLAPECKEYTKIVVKERKTYKGN